jgi:hypothetical protein
LACILYNSITLPLETMIDYKWLTQ